METIKMLQMIITRADILDLASVSAGMCSRISTPSRHRRIQIAVIAIQTPLYDIGML